MSAKVRLKSFYNSTLNNTFVIYFFNGYTLDLPEVSLVAILDADKEGFLCSAKSLTQTVGRAARHLNGKAIMYADKITKNMQATIDATNYRREKQIAYNTKHNITPTAIKKSLENVHTKAKTNAYIK